MLEILLIIGLCKKIGGIVRAKGHKAGWYQFLLVALWFGGEFGAALAAGIISMILLRGQEPNMLIVYLFALVGAGTGAAIAFLIANGVSPAEEHYAQDEFDYPRKRRPARRSEDWHIEGEARRAKNPDWRYEEDK